MICAQYGMSLSGDIYDSTRNLIPHARTVTSTLPSIAVHGAQRAHALCPAHVATSSGRTALVYAIQLHTSSAKSSLLNLHLIATLTSSRASSAPWSAQREKSTTAGLTSPAVARLKMLVLKAFNIPLQAVRGSTRIRALLRARLDFCAAPRLVV